MVCIKQIFLDFALINEYRYPNLSGCESLQNSFTAVTFKTDVLTSKTDTVALRVMDKAGSTLEQHFSVDLTGLSQNSLDVNRDRNVNILDLAQIAANFGQTRETRSDVNDDGVVNVLVWLPSQTLLINSDTYEFQPFLLNE